MSLLFDPKVISELRNFDCGLRERIMQTLDDYVDGQHALKPVAKPLAGTDYHYLEVSRSRVLIKEIAHEGCDHDVRVMGILAPA